MFSFQYSGLSLRGLSRLSVQFLWSVYTTILKDGHPAQLKCILLLKILSIYDPDDFNLLVQVHTGALGQPCRYPSNGWNWISRLLRHLHPTGLSAILTLSQRSSNIPFQFPINSNGRDVSIYLTDSGRLAPIEAWTATSLLSTFWTNKFLSGSRKINFTSRSISF